MRARGYVHNTALYVLGSIRVRALLELHRRQQLAAVLTREPPRVAQVKTQGNVARSRYDVGSHILWGEKRGLSSRGPRNHCHYRGAV